MSFILGIVFGVAGAYAFAAHCMEKGKVIKILGYECQITVL